MAKGIGLFESLIYLSCSLLFVTFAGKLVLEVQKSVRGAAAYAERLVELAIALDTVCSCLQQAPRENAHWKITDLSCVVYKTDAGDRGILIDKGRLVMVSGSYDPQSGIWRGRAQSVLLERAILALTYHRKAGVLLGVTVKLGALHNDHILELSSCVAMRPEEMGRCR